MKLEKQVTSLELSKKLKELGMKQESLFYWLSSHEKGASALWYKPEIGAYNFMGAGISDRTWQDNIRYSAYTVAELGEMLPGATTLTRRAVDGQWRYPDSVGASLYADTEANARAKMLIYLIENNLIDLK